MRVPSLKVFVTLIIIVSVAVVSGSFLYTKFNQPQKPQDKVQNQTLLPSSPPVVCKRFTNLGESLKNIEIACVLDLSKQNLTYLPGSILKLKNLTDLSLKNNKLSMFPTVIFNMQSLQHLDISDNQLIDLPPQLFLFKNLKSLDLAGNNLSEDNKKTVIKFFPFAKL